MRDRTQTDKVLLMSKFDLKLSYSEKEEYPHENVLVCVHPYRVMGVLRSPRLLMDGSIKRPAFRWREFYILWSADKDLLRQFREGIGVPSSPTEVLGSTPGSFVDRGVILLNARSMRRALARGAVAIDPDGLRKLMRIVQTASLNRTLRRIPSVLPGDIAPRNNDFQGRTADLTFLDEYETVMRSPLPAAVLGLAAGAALGQSSADRFFHVDFSSRPSPDGRAGTQQTSLQYLPDGGLGVARALLEALTRKILQMLHIARREEDAPAGAPVAPISIEIAFRRACEELRPQIFSGAFLQIPTTYTSQYNFICSAQATLSQGVVYRTRLEVTADNPAQPGQRLISEYHFDRGAL